MAILLLVSTAAVANSWPWSGWFSHDDNKTVNNSTVNVTNTSTNVTVPTLNETKIMNSSASMDYIRNFNKTNNDSKSSMDNKSGLTEVKDMPTKAEDTITEMKKYT